MGIRRITGAAVAALLLVTAAAVACGGRESAGGTLLLVESDAPEGPPLAWGLGSAPGPSAAPATAPAPTQPAPPTADSAAQRPAPEPAPPEPPPRFEGECIASRAGEPASMPKVATALREAAGRTYWPVSAPEISVPLDLVRAVAWQESGWQSEIVACDGGVGVMQVMPDTAEFVNRRFEVSYDIHTLAGNATLGANYLAWLIKYFGDVHFDGSYRLAAGDCADHQDPCLLNAVIAAYNFGPAAVESGDGLAIPNPGYVANVRALMAQCPCDAH